MAPRGGVSNPIRVIVAEDNPDLRSAVVALINDEPDLECVGETDDIDAVTALTQSLCPDVVLLDWELQGRSAVGLLSTDIAQKVAFIIFSGYAHPQFIQQAVAAGARDFVVKNGDFAAVLTSIRRHAAL